MPHGPSRSHRSLVSTSSQRPRKKLTIIGGGIIAAFEAYFAYLDALSRQERIAITLYEKNPSVQDSTIARIVPSLTPDEILSVVPRGPELVKMLNVLFSEPGGIRVEDVKGVNGSKVAEAFKQAALAYSRDEAGHEARTKALLQLGKLSMLMWDKLYETADAELRQIFEDANYNPCKEPPVGCEALHQGYRVDPIFDVPQAARRAEGMMTTYQTLGFKQCRLLSPSDVLKRDPALTSFVHENTNCDPEGVLSWKDNAIALWRPGGCIDSGVFMPKFFKYLEKKLGHYIDRTGRRQPCFKMHFESHVVGVTYSSRQDAKTISGLKLKRSPHKVKVKKDRRIFQSSEYVFCPGEAVGTLRRMGFSEPAYARFAGPTLRLSFPVPKDDPHLLTRINHCMEVHQEGVVLAWQARIKDGHLFIGVGGTKAFYADKSPTNEQAFAKNRHVLQLNIINKVLPEYVSYALGRETKGETLRLADLNQLEASGVAERWVGSRAVTYDGVPTWGQLKTRSGQPIQKARTTTHLGSGGGSFAPGAVAVSRSAFFKRGDHNSHSPKPISEGNGVERQALFFQQGRGRRHPLYQDLLEYGDCARKPA